MLSVDVIVPCYRYGHFLRKCVESVLCQSLHGVRVLIIDDASPDNTDEIASELVKEDSRVAFRHHVTNRGHIDTYNEGIEWATAKYLLILSADDYLLPGALWRAAQFLDLNAEAGLAFGKSIETNTDQIGLSPDELSRLNACSDWRLLKGSEFIDLSGARNIVSTPTAVVRTVLQKRLGGYRFELPHSGDMEMWFRLAAHGSVGITDAYQAVYRRHSENMSLAYMTQGWLPDLQQRKAAINCFFETCSDALPDAKQINRRLLKSLAVHAVNRASRAFNEEEMEISEQLSRFALSICPEIKQSLQWAKLTCKRQVGYSAWNSWRMTTARMRQVRSLLS